MRRVFYILLLAVSPVFLQATDYVAIVEILYDTPLNENPALTPHNYGEFVTLYNYGEDAVNLQGWSLQTVSPLQTVILPETVLPPKGCLMVAYGTPDAYGYAGDYSNNWSDFHKMYNLDPTDFPVLFQTDMMLPNDTCSVLLCDSLGLTRDSVRYGPWDGWDTMTASNTSVSDIGMVNVAALRTVRRAVAVFTVQGTTVFHTSNWQSKYDPAVPVNYIGKYPPPVSMNIQSPSVESDNYIVQVIPQTETDVVPELGLEGKMADALVSVQRYDAIGRPVQTIRKNITPSGKHLLTYREYDKYNRPTQEWLPVASDFSFLEMGAFRNASAQFYLSETVAYEETLYSQDTLADGVLRNSITGVRKAGKDMGTRSVRCGRQTNAAERVKLFTVDMDGRLRNAGYYAPGTLVHERTSDEDAKVSSTYTDREGRVVMTCKGTDADTYYVYNALGQLAYVLPPLAADALGTGIYADDVTPLKKYAYIYRYDDRGNCVYKRLPGCEPVRMIYDSNNRLAISQDAGQLADGCADAYKYDAFGRLLYSGNVRSPLLADGWDGLAMQIRNVNAVEWYCADEGVNTLFDTHYTRSWDAGMEWVQLYQVNYYDTYDFLEFAYTDCLGYDYTQERVFGTLCDNAKGLLTATFTGKFNTNPYICSTMTVYYYDTRGRMIQKRTTNHLGGCDTEYNAYDFVGRLVRSDRTHTTERRTTDERYNYTYDAAGRLLTTQYTHHRDSTQMQSRNVYDELGRLKTTILYGGVDSICYNYNIRNQLTQIKSRGFEQNLYYTSHPPQSTSGMPCYNGNISYSTWTYGNTINGYMYMYDPLNRLKYTYSILNGEFGDYYYTEAFQYDKQSNITRLERWGDSFDAINQLSFFYDGNRVDKITDNGYPPCGYRDKHYRDEADADPEMGYDANGNMVYDLDRGISAVRYNRLNLPDTVQFANGSQIVHSYNALGRRLATTYYTRKVATAVPVGTTLAPSANLSDYNVLNYAYNDNMVYIDYNNHGLWELDYVHTPVGYVRYYGPEEHYPFYYIRDYLGNVREVWVHPWLNHSEYVQRTQYYPSGLPWNEGYSPSEQPYKYGGKEFVEMHGLDEYDSEARWYYPAIMRTTTMDPHCEQYYDTSPYVWCGNNLVNNVDPDGKEPIYNLTGTFLGTDNQGLQGEYIIMQDELFEQNMSHIVAEEAAYSGYIPDEIRQKISNHHTKLVQRPDFDGFVTITEGVEWAKKHPNALSDPTPDNTLYINTSKLDFGKVSTSDFKEEGVITAINLFPKDIKRLIYSTSSAERRGTVYALGRVNMILLNRDTREVVIVNDNATSYDWNIGGGGWRNFFIKTERIRTGLNDSHGFRVFYYGHGKLRK